MSGGREADIGGMGSNHKIMHWIICSSVWTSDIRVIKLLYWLVTNSSLSLVLYIFEYWPLPLTSTSRPLTQRMTPGLPHFFPTLPLPCILNTNQRTKHRRDLGTRLDFTCVWTVHVYQTQLPAWESGNKTTVCSVVTLAEWVLSFSNMGTRNAAVFPEPVLAMATTSLPSITSGIHCVQKVKRAGD